MKPQIILTTALLTVALPAPAQISTDGTLGPSVNLEGPNFQIGANLGQQHGPNLFHSFRDFNLSHHEIATFSGPNSVQNVLSRVTGGKPSNIDGLFRSTISGANMYFLNPYGILFGPNARLDVQGSFHASTADYLRLDEGGRFDVRNPNDSILTVAPVESFGFLSNSPAKITTQDSQLVVPNGRTLSLIGGDIDLSGHSPIMFDEQGIMAISSSKLSAPAGRINLASVASVGEVIPSELGLDLNADGGKITVNKTLIESNGKGGGAIFIRGEQLVMQDATLLSRTFGDQDGKDIDLELTQSVTISGDLFAILSTTFGSGNSANINIFVPHLEINESSLHTETVNTGLAGNIKIEGVNVSLKKGSLISSYSFGSSGNAGDILIRATEAVYFLGIFPGIKEGDIVLKGINDTSRVNSLSINSSGHAGNVTIDTHYLVMEPGQIGSTSILGSGNSGEILVQADEVRMAEGAVISVSTYGSGQGGKLTVKVTGQLLVTGKFEGLRGPIDSPFENVPSEIGSAGYPLIPGIEIGKPGNTFISAHTMIVDEQAIITATNGSQSEGAHIKIQVENLIVSNDAKISTSNTSDIGGYFSVGSGQGGNIELHAKKLTVTNGGNITASSVSTGNAGQIIVQADNVNLTRGSKITTEAENASGGNITFIIPNLLYLQNSEIITSVHDGTGGGGNITIENPTFVVSNQGQIKAQADAGHGGNIRIVADQFIASPDSLVSASSRLGLDGDVQIDSPAVDMDSFLVVLPGSDDEVELQLPKGCTVEDILNPRTTFHVRTVPEGRLKSPEGFME